MEPDVAKHSLFCVLAEDSESWSELAQEEHAPSKIHKYYPSRFDRAEWRPLQKNGTSETSKGCYEGTLIVPLSFLETSLKQSLSATRAKLCMRYAATAPWHDEYAVMDLLVFDGTSGRQMSVECPPRTKLPVPVHEAWKAIFPPDVFERFRAREAKY